MSTEILLTHKAEKPGDDTGPGPLPEGEAQARRRSTDTGIPAQHSADRDNHTAHATRHSAA